ncbi:uncharacterized protein LOC130404185 isoform X2 [Gadus chalcogrammus]|uniref:uncharacterized protein LOC130404185 isoform X2 n=1 Tax=Gadus chalcogrammus TaxID=1042646 RepID=UPI0024C4C036|nr:uncharacterized protein LOC130404185 isoform X2 [Gadus chalcogrammus]
MVMIPRESSTRTELELELAVARWKSSLSPVPTSRPIVKMLLRVSFGVVQEYMKLPELTFSDFLREVSLKFNIAEDRRLDIKIYDQSNTEVDSEVFEEIVQEFHGPFLISLANEAPGYPQSTSSPCSIASEDTVILNFSLCDPAEEPVAAEGSQPKRPCRINYEAKALIEKILTTKPGGDRVMEEYAKTKSITDSTRRQLINILTAEMTETHGTSPPRSVKVMYAQGIVALLPYLEDPYSQNGYEHYYDPESGSGYIAWRLKTIQRKAAEERGPAVSTSPKVGGPGHGRTRPFTADRVLTDEEVECAIALLRHTADEETIREKMKVTFAYRHAMVNDENKSAEVFSVFPRFLDTPGLIEQDFRVMFGEQTANKFMERWPTTFKAGVIKESHGLVPSTDLLDLMRNAETSTEVEKGWDSDMSAIILLLHLLPPSAQGRKWPGKISASNAVDHLIKFQKTGTSVQQHLDNIAQSIQPYLLAQGPTKSSIHSFFIAIDKHALPCQATSSVGALDELFKAHYVFDQDGVLLLIEPATNPPVYEADENIAMDGSERTETVVEEAAGTSGSQYQHLTTKELYRLHLQREIAKADLQMEYTKLLMEVKKKGGWAEIQRGHDIAIQCLIILFFLPQQLKNKND